MEVNERRNLFASALFAFLAAASAAPAQDAPPLAGVSGRASAPQSEAKEGCAIQHLLSSEELKFLPLDRRFPAMFAIAPGVRASKLSGGFAVRGTSALESLAIIEGLNVTDPLLGLLENRLPLEFFSSFDLITGGISAEDLSSTGGVLLGRIPAGTNEFHGNVFGYWTDERLAASSRPTAFRRKAAGADLSLFLDAFNATNNQMATEAYENYYLQRRTLRDAPLDPNWGKETARQSPRLLRTGFRWSF